jgi:hypothetical protein
MGEVAVRLWRTDGEAVATPPGLERVELSFDEEDALGDLVVDVGQRTGLRLALLRVTDDLAHFEVLGGEADGLAWRAPVAGEAIGGGAPWNRLGWFAATRDRIAEVLGTRVTSLRQVKHWSISAIAAAETGRGEFWWKQVPAFMAHEARLTQWLSSRHPGVVPDVVAVGDDWSLCRPFPEAAPSSAPTECPYGVLAALQLEAAAEVEQLLARSCPDRRSEAMAADLAALAERRDLLEPDTADELRAQLPRVRDDLAALAAGPVPASLVHGDLHRGNWLRRADGGWFLFDWTDGCVGHPFLDLGVLPREDVAVREARLGAYLAPWREAVGAAATDRTLALALPLAAAFQAVSYQRIVDGVGSADADEWRPVVTSYVRRLLEPAG